MNEKFDQQPEGVKPFQCREYITGWVRSRRAQAWFSDFGMLKRAWDGPSLARMATKRRSRRVTVGSSRMTGQPISPG